MPDRWDARPLPLASLNESVYRILVSKGTRCRICWSPRIVRPLRFQSLSEGTSRKYSCQGTPISFMRTVPADLSERIEKMRFKPGTHVRQTTVQVRAAVHTVIGRKLGQRESTWS